jgi:ZIP family zinc transporter
MPASGLATPALFACIPALAAAAGASIAVLRTPRPPVTRALQHLAAGVVFAVVAVELLPEVIRARDPVEIGWTFGAGVAFMLGVEWVSTRLAAAGPGRRRLSLVELVGIGVDMLLDGILVGIAFAVGARQGRLLAAALGAEFLSLAMSMASGLARRGAGRGRAVAVPSALALLVVVGTLVGATVLRDAGQRTIAGVASFGCAALLYLVTEDLLVEAHEAPHSAAATVLFFAGFLGILLFGTLMA